MEKKVQLIDCGRISFSDAWEWQSRLSAEKNTAKIFNRNHPGQAMPIGHHLLFCEHNPVYTLGKSGSEENLLLSLGELGKSGIDFFRINRGGDITFHGPGQLTGYPILDLEDFFTDIHKYMRYLEEVIIRVCARFGLNAGRIKGLTGVWVDWENPQKARKICALGVHMSRWITLHGFGLNVSTDLAYFSHIIPCGITDKGVTSLSAELGRTVSMEEAKVHVKTCFSEVFGVELLEHTG
jgi:lipoyl(octanoyl) transferase